MKKHVKNQNMLSFLAIQKYAKKQLVPMQERHVRAHNMIQNDASKFFKNYSSEFSKLHNSENHQ